MARVQTGEQTGRLQECDMPHSPSGRLCLLDAGVSMSAKRLWKMVEVEVYLRNKQLQPVPVDSAPSGSAHLHSDSTLTFSCWKFKSCVDFYLKVCDKQCTARSH